MYCNPDVCPHCQYIGEGDSWCDELHEIVLSDWEPTEHYMGLGCPYLAQPRRRKRRRNRKKKGPDAGTIVKYAVLTLLGVWLYRLGADYALQQRGYFAVGGEGVRPPASLFLLGCEPHGQRLRCGRETEASNGDCREDYCGTEGRRVSGCR